MHGKCTLFFKKNLTFYARFLKIPMHVFHGIKSGIDVHVMPKIRVDTLPGGSGDYVRRIPRSS